MITIESDQHQFEIAEHGVTVIFGPTGIGKTTLLRQIAGHLPLCGRLVIGDEVIACSESIIKPHKRGFAYLSQYSSLVRQFSVKRNLSLAIQVARSPLTQEDITEIYQICHIEHLLDRQANQVSGGESQQICLAMAMLSKPRLMLLDEPVSALDMRLKYDVLAQFKQWLHRHSIPVIYVSHEVNEIALIADNMVIIDPIKAAEYRSYQAWLADVNSDFVTHSLAVNTLHAQFVKTEYDLNLMCLSTAADITFWAQGNIEHEKEYIVELAITDVSISLELMPHSSILNQLNGVIVAISRPFNGYQFVAFKLATVIITARLTVHSVMQLQLRTELSCYVCFKTPRVVPLRK